MKRHLLPIAALLAAGAAHADDLEPGFCPVAPSTITFDLGAYRGAYLATFANGKRIGHSGWQTCPPKPPGRETSLDGCSFSLCNLPDDSYEIRFADAPAPAAFHFKAKSGRIDMEPSPLGTQVAFYGVDASAGHRPLTLDLQGFALSWSIAHWPGPFHGTDTRGHAYTDGGKVILSLYPATPYTFHFSGAPAVLTLDRSGTISANAGGAVAVHGNVAQLRVARLQITPPGAGGWSVDDTDMQGPQAVSIPAGATVSLLQGKTPAQTLTLDSACRVTTGAGAFKVAPAPGTDVRQTCP